MSKRLRLLAVPAALALAMVPSGIALADPTDTPLETVIESATSPLTGSTDDGTTDEGSTDATQSSSAGTTSSTPTRTTAPANPLGDVGEGLDALITGSGTTTSGTTTSGTTTSGTPTSETPTSETTTSSSAPPADPPACVAAVVEKLLTDLQAALGAGGEELAAAIQAALADPAHLPAFLEGLPDLLAEQGEDLATEGELLLTRAGEDLQECLPAPPTGGGTQTPAPTKPAPTAQPEQPFTYKDCDEARAHGAAPVYAGQHGYGTHLDSDSDGIGCEIETVAYTQPTNYGTGKLAYTGVATEPLLAWGAALLASGAWLILSGRRRA